MSITPVVIMSALAFRRRHPGPDFRAPYNRFSVEEGRPTDTPGVYHWERWERCVRASEAAAREAGIDVTRCDARPAILSGARARWFAGLAAAERAEAAERRCVRVLVAVLVAAGAALVAASIALA